VWRSAALTPLSHDHQHALDVARRLRRATPADVGDALAYLRAFWVREGQRHFELEERHLSDALPDAEWRAQIERMLREHETIRARVAAVAGVESAHELGTLLHDHVRFEERELFPWLESRLPEPELATLGAALAHDRGG
jgi:hemerythrin-like domain-containing protein